MKTPGDKEQEEEALEALIVAAYWGLLQQGDDTPELCGPEPSLSEEDERAFRSIPSDFVSRLVDGTWRCAQPDQERREELLEVSGAMNRGNDANDLTDVAREEIERRIREDDEEEQKRRKTE